MGEPYLRLRQVCLVADNLADVAKPLSSLLALTECYRDPHLAEYGLENVIYPVGKDRFIEIVAPIQPDTAAQRFLEKSGGQGGYMLIFDCDNPAERAANANMLGIRTANHIDRPQYQGFQLHPKDCQACFIELNNTPGGETLEGPYWPAGPDWQAHTYQTRTEGWTGADIVSPDPVGLAATWSQILDQPMSVAGDAALEVDEHTITFKHSGTDRDWLDTLVVQLIIDPAIVIAEAQALGLQTTADAFHLAGVWFRLVRA